MQYERRILLLGLLIGLPGAAVALALLWTGGPSRGRWMLTLLVLVLWCGFALYQREQVIRPLQTLSNLLAGLREGDFSVASRGARPDDALGLALLEVNALSTRLREQRLGALEATALLRTVMAEIDVAVFAFDGDDALRLVNRAGERLLGAPAARLLGRRADEVGLAPCLAGDAPRMVEAAFPGGSGRWEVRRTTFRQAGLPHHLLVLSDLSRALREEERQAWQRLVRVLSHEINNSLAPIRSIAGSLRDLMRRDPPPPDLREDLEQGLDVVAARAAALGRFMASYARLARLPRPEMAPLEVEPWVRRVASLETRVPVSVRPGPPTSLHADGDQLDQLLINLVRNAADASLETGGALEVGWALRDGLVELWVRDQGQGLADTANLFVPFYTTKPHGTGIGLVLSRQIAEAHGGTLTLANRPDAPGCTARLLLPAGRDAAAATAETSAALAGGRPRIAD
ncbi:MAG: PAS domain-containing protein [Gemmatimonadetes bacterium]|nr:PAS domain-containing protein [Gemmatimonadota bacterium]